MRCRASSAPSGSVRQYSRAPRRLGSSASIRAATSFCRGENQSSSHQVARPTYQSRCRLRSRTASPVASSHSAPYARTVSSIR